MGNEIELKLKEMPSGVQFSTFDRILERMGSIEEHDVEKGALFWLMEVIDDEVSIASSEMHEDY